MVKIKGSSPGFCAEIRKQFVKYAEECEAIIAFSLVSKKNGNSHILPSGLVDISSSRLTTQ